MYDDCRHSAIKVSVGQGFSNGFGDPRTGKANVAGRASKDYARCLFMHSSQSEKLIAAASSGTLMLCHLLTVIALPIVKYCAPDYGLPSI